MKYNRLKIIREYEDISATEMAKIMKVSRSTYSGWENNIDSIPLIKLNDFCNYFNLSMDYVVGISDKKNRLNSQKNIDRDLVSKRLKEIRTRNNDTQKECAAKINTSQSNISNYENGDYLIISTLLCAFCIKYKVSMNYICGK